VKATVINVSVNNRNNINTRRHISKQQATFDLLLNGNYAADDTYKVRAATI